MRTNMAMFNKECTSNGQQGATVHKVRMLFFLIIYIQYAYIILLYVNRTYDENKLCVSCLQPKFTKVSTVFVIDSRKYRR